MGVGLIFESTDGDKVGEEKGAECALTGHLHVSASAPHQQHGTSRVSERVAGYSSRGHKELDATERACTCTLQVV